MTQRIHRRTTLHLDHDETGLDLELVGDMPPGQVPHIMLRAGRALARLKPSEARLLASYLEANADELEAFIEDATRGRR